MLELRPTPFDHPAAVRLIAEVQQEYRVRYGGEDVTPTDPRQFASPHGYFVVGYVDGEAVACGGWRARDGAHEDGTGDGNGTGDGDGTSGGDALRVGDAEIKRMYVVAAHRGRGYARAVLAELERTAIAAGRRRAVLETGTAQPEALALYATAGYEPMLKFGAYRHSPSSRCFAKPLVSAAADDREPAPADAASWAAVRS